MHSIGRTDEGENPLGKGKKTTANKIKQGAKVTKNIGASAEFIDAMDKSLKGNSKILGRFGSVGSYLSAGGQIVYDGIEYINGEISGYRFTFRAGSTITSFIAGAEVGTAIGGAAGFVVGTTIGLGAGTAESTWDLLKPQFIQSFNNFINTATSNWMRYR